MTANSIQRAFRNFTDNPEAGKVHPTATASLANGRARITSGPFNWDADLPPAIGGANQSPSPTAYLLGALAGCAVVFVHATLAPEFEVEVEDLTAEARCAADLGGLLGVADADPRKRDLELTIRLKSGSSPGAVERLQRAWRKRCPIYLALLEPAGVQVSFVAEGAA